MKEFITCAWVIMWGKIHTQIHYIHKHIHHKIYPLDKSMYYIMFGRAWDEKGQIRWRKNPQLVGFSIQLNHLQTQTARPADRNTHPVGWYSVPHHLQKSSKKKIRLSDFLQNRINMYKVKNNFDNKLMLLVWIKANCSLYFHISWEAFNYLTPIIVKS